MEKRQVCVKDIGFYPFLACKDRELKCMDYQLKPVETKSEYSKKYELRLEFKKGTKSESTGPVKLWYILRYGGEGCYSNRLHQRNIPWTEEIAEGGFVWRQQFWIRGSRCPLYHVRIIAAGLYHYAPDGPWDKPKTTRYGLGCTMTIELNKYPGPYKYYYASICVPKSLGRVIPGLARFIIKDTGKTHDRIIYGVHTDRISGGKPATCFNVGLSPRLAGGKTIFDARVIIPMAGEPQVAPPKKHPRRPQPKPQPPSGPRPGIPVPRFLEPFFRHRL